MKSDASADKRRWMVAIGAGVVATLVFGTLFRAPRPPASPPPAAKPAVTVAPPDTLLGEETALRDPAPLSLPTEWNSRPAPPERDPGVAFSSYPPETHFATDALALALPNDVPAKPADARLSNAPGNPILGMGRTDAPVPALGARGGLLEIAAAGTGEPVLSAILADAHPPDGVFWHPLEFIAAVDAAGLVGPLVLSVPSSSDTVNAYFEGYLAQTFRVGDRLAPGFYHLRVEP
jgi:hypothetical protein